MTDKVVEFPGITTLDLPPERVLQKALDKGLDGVVVMGYDEDGEEYFCSSYADGGEVLWLMERMKLKLLTVLDD